MSGRVAGCPSCGAQLVFKAGSSIVAVCAYCQTAVGRVGGDVGELEILGKVAPLAAIGSPLRVGSQGKVKGRGFRLVGRVQLDWGQGPWNEWYAAFDDGDWGWIAEAQGQVYLTFPRPVPKAPGYSDWRVGSRFSFPNATVVAVERRTATVVSAEGELPTQITPGARVRYVDVEGPGGVFGTVDFGEGEAIEAVYLGVKSSYAELFDASELSATEGHEPAAAVLDLKCPSCGAAVELREPDEAQRISCARCESLLDVKQGSALFLVQAATRKAPPLQIPLGATGTRDGEKWTVYARLVRSVTVEGVRYAWEEYLLRGEKRQGWRWLLVANGHWSWVEPVSVADVAVGTFNRAKYRGEVYRHFQTSSPAVEHIQGELYWKVAVGERVRATDYVAPPYVLSEEVGDGETTWSRGRYLEPSEVEAMFKLKKPLPEPTGVAPNQPNPHDERRRAVGRQALLATGALCLLGLLVAARSPGRIVYEATHRLADGNEVVLSDKFRLERRANLEVTTTADVDNSWFFLSGSLIDESTSEVQPFGVEVSYYHGVSGGESWSEGGRSDSVYLGAVAPGEYTLRLEPQWDKQAGPSGPYPGSPPSIYTVRVRSDVFLPSHWFSALFALWLYPLWLVLRRASFEGRRWKESDHAG